MARTDYLDLLNHIDPTQLDYNEWLAVGMALKHEGYKAVDWKIWSERDPKRFKPTECWEKWQTFTEDAETIITGATIVQFAKNQGYTLHSKVYNWDDEFDVDDDAEDGTLITDKAWIEEDTFQIPTDAEWQPLDEIKEYLNTLFKPNEYVGYVVNSQKTEKGKFVPATGGVYNRTAGELVRLIDKYQAEEESKNRLISDGKCDKKSSSLRVFEKVFGKYDSDAGAWIRFNPLDGQGVKNGNVTEFKYALVESDTVKPEMQMAIIKELQLPVACLVYSGGKSVHAIVKIGAGTDSTEYRKRVEYLYKTCEKNGMSIDKQNKNPSRLSRLPGVYRGGNKQFLIATNIGKSSFEEWKDWIEEVTDELPDPENLADVWNNMQPLAEELIEGILRQGHKMLVAGQSKAGKSFLLIQLCIAIAEGRQWLGHRCKQGRVMYVNLELDQASCEHRFKDVYTALGIDKPKNLANIDIWHLRGKQMPMDRLAPKLIRRAEKRGDYIAIVIDPLYKVAMGDENNASEIGAFFNQFDKICNELGCAMIYCHHHSKGAQGAKRAADRASGSGVFARDPDALLDMIELNINADAAQKVIDRFLGHECLKILEEQGQDISELKQPANEAEVMETIERYVDEEDKDTVIARLEQARASAGKVSGWRVESTLREFEGFSPIDLFFCHPLHYIDTEEILKSAKPDFDIWHSKTERLGKRRKTNQDLFYEAMDVLTNDADGKPPKTKELAMYLGKVDENGEIKRSVYDLIRTCGYTAVKTGKLKGRIVKSNTGETEE